MTDLERLTKAELIARFEDIDEVSLAAARAFGILKALQSKISKYHPHYHQVIDNSAVFEALEQICVRFGATFFRPEED